MPEQSEVRLRQQLLQSGEVSREQLDECVRLQEDRKSTGGARSLTAILQEKGYLSSERLGELWRDLAREEPFDLRGPTGSASSAARVVPGPASKIGKYDLLEEIGRGGMGTVYKARDSELGRTVALKLVVAAEYSESAVKRLQREAKLMARLEHPNVVRVYEVGQAAGYHYYSMEYVDGRPLERAFRDKALGLPDRLRIVAGAARGLDAAHKLGVVHRDVKPGNILLDSQGHPRVSDFGLAKEIDLGSTLTRTGTVLGTPAYLSPEVAEGGAKRIDARSDIFSLGVVLYEALTGSIPFLGESMIDTLVAIRHKDPTPPRKVNPGLPREVESICLKAMEKEARQRYETAGAMADDIERHLRGEPVLARPVSTLTLVVRRARRHRAILAVVALSIVALATLGVLYLESRKREAEEKRQHEQEVELQQKLNDLVSRAQLFASQGFAQEALQLLDTASGLDPKWYVPHERKADVYRRTKNFKAALRELGKAIEKDPQRAELLAARASLYFFVIGDNLRAMADVQRLLKLEPDHPLSALGGCAQTYLLGDKRAATNCLSARIAKKPDDAMAYALRGAMQMEAGLHAEAVADSRKAIELDPQNAIPYNTLAQIALSESKWDEAIQHATRHIELFPDAPHAHAARGSARFEKGDFSGALADAEEALKVLPRLASAHRVRGIALYLKGDLLEAEKALDRSLKFSKNKNSRSLFYRGLARARQGKNEEALADVEASSDAFRDDPDVTSVRGVLRARLGRLEGARADLGELRRIAPQSPLVENLDGLIERAAGNFERAVELFTLAMEKQVGYPPQGFLRNRGLTYAEMGRAKEAIADLEKALEIDPTLAGEIQPVLDKLRAGE